MPTETVTFELPYRPPYDWAGLTDFLRARVLKGAEWVSTDAYLRTVRLGSRRGWLKVCHVPEKSALRVELSAPLKPAEASITHRLEHLFDLGARPDAIRTVLGHDSILRERVMRFPGLRLPGAFDGFEMAVRAILGQQITVKAATTLAGRFVDAFGDKIATPFPELNHLFPSPKKVAALTVSDIAQLGIISARARSIGALAQACAESKLLLEPGTDPHQTMEQLVQIPGIGPWTAHYIAMRGLCWPDAFPKEDIAVRNQLGGVTPKRAEELSQRWRPWRSYAVLYLWRAL